MNAHLLPNISEAGGFSHGLPPAYTHLLEGQFLNGAGGSYQISPPAYAQFTGCNIEAGGNLITPKRIKYHIPQLNTFPLIMSRERTGLDKVLPTVFLTSPLCLQNLLTLRHSVRASQDRFTHLFILPGLLFTSSMKLLVCLYGTGQTIIYINILNKISIMFKNTKIIKGDYFR